MECLTCDYYDIEEDRCTAFECNGIECPELPCEVWDTDEQNNER